MTRVYLLTHLLCLCLMCEVFTLPFRSRGSRVARFISVRRPPWVFVKPWDLWARKSARFAAEALLDPEYSIYVHVLTAKGLVSVENN
jgi:hypothetical protein